MEKLDIVYASLLISPAITLMGVWGWSRLRGAEKSWGFGGQKMIIKMEPIVWTYLGSSKIQVLYYTVQEFFLLKHSFHRMGNIHRIACTRQLCSSVGMETLMIRVVRSKDCNVCLSEYACIFSYICNLVFPCPVHRSYLSILAPGRVIAEDCMFKSQSIFGHRPDTTCYSTVRIYE